MTRSCRLRNSSNINGINTRAFSCKLLFGFMRQPLATTILKRFSQKLTERIGIARSLQTAKVCIQPIPKGHSPVPFTRKEQVNTLGFPLSQQLPFRDKQFNEDIKFTNGPQRSNEMPESFVLTFEFLPWKAFSEHAQNCPQPPGSNAHVVRRFKILPFDCALFVRESLLKTCERNLVQTRFQVFAWIKIDYFPWSRH